ncbi:phospholipid carrier-dependent glycosyltransferase [Streptomyces sp. SL13]|uniref:Polyprenol-phosphate-mannose--protein mannosyltransferase n=1 Tax=Streptantibioticus silvisoli TaxID=2705255 RepID=A0AA90KC46_9ACTN|nr:phospholipid carrier-dependent glycosyltransferase [Streptantibioticus silvisoli]MDI5966185.1 phospholipid carrier-dependent glycosyltransferase [Streptantibioticus silvisoli]MDI5974503.1 phospholipid carrier-dependent glycosyltransferase [Streptantibioticus silvisoli]
MTSESADTATGAGQGATASGRPGDPEAPSAWELRLRRFGHRPRPHGSARDRLVVPFQEPGTRIWELLGLKPDVARRAARWTGWGGPLLVAVFAGVLRFYRLGSPRAVIFDETYYAKDAWALLHLGYEGTWPANANTLILQHPQQIPLSSAPSYVVHPPDGKWVISLGEWMFGLNPFGWRFMLALLGTLAVLMLCRIGRRLTRSTAIGCLAGVLMSVDGLEFVMSRTSLLDLIVMFWVLAAFGALLVDRDKARERLAAALPDSGRADPQAAWSARLGLRPWRLAAGVLLGVACATKWNGMFYLAAFAVMSVLWDVGARRVAGAGSAFAAMLRRDALPAFLSLVPVAFATYLVSWSGWFLTGNGYYRHWADHLGGPWAWIPAPLRSLWHYQHQVYLFNINLSQPHTYQSNPWSWLVLGRPVSYFYESPKPGQDGCTAAGGCAREVLALGTPLLWWSACFALLYLIYRWAMRRDWRAGAVLCGVAAGYLPWFNYQQRTIFLFYAVVFVPYLCLALAMMLGAALGPRGAPERRRMWGAVGAGTLVLLIVWNFIYFYPLYTGMTIPLDAWRNRMWLDTWI